MGEIITVNLNEKTLIQTRANKMGEKLTCLTYSKKSLSINVKTQYYNTRSYICSRNTFPPEWTIKDRQTTEERKKNWKNLHKKKKDEQWPNRTQQSRILGVGTHY